jgi:predicted nucleic acid-binding protein
VGIDTVAFIYWMEEHPKFSPVLQPIFESIHSGTLPAVVSSLTLLEVLVVPYRTGNLQLAERYESFLTRSRGLRFMDLDRSILRAAAALRARFPTLRTPDALQIATALAGNCRFFLTNDRGLPAVPGIEIVLLDRTRGDS